MSLRPGLIPQLARFARPTVQKRAFHLLHETRAARPSNPFKRVHDARAVTRAAPVRKNNSTLLYSIGLGLAGFALTTRTVRCEAANTQPARVGEAQQAKSSIINDDDQPVESIVSLPSLTFGALTGICAGVFVKKGFKFVAFLLGGLYVILQYLQSKRYVTVDWDAVSKSYDGKFTTTNEKGDVVYPTAQGVLSAVIDFLTSNFQQRASFIAGFLLGLRVG
ncbi:hypothetical protein CspeluHIS016_0701230 [Cutaneotrichosporon spelunceum]|uniref:FUN14-domain-containing protein n=1 Tax=Cutaneotrichosporon spelunceum TaxID=1672016 RepID=A0AAD3YEF7_9TREE|nr:hypothetical protein CspeluHIS016_0701230 [Cutaneotrichosporon spelunceum]